MRRREFVGLAGAAAIAWPAVARAQQPAKVARIGFLGLDSESNHASRVAALRAGLRDLMACVFAILALVLAAPGGAARARPLPFACKFLQRIRYTLV
jgi:hypothetical protein